MVKDCKIEIRLSVKEKKTFKDIAISKGFSISDFFRFLFDDYLDKENTFKKSSSRSIRKNVSCNCNIRKDLIYELFKVHRDLLVSKNIDDQIILNSFDSLELILVNRCQS